MNRVIFEGKGAVLGRLGAKAAKELLKGKHVAIINAEEVIVSGSKELVVENIKRKRKMGAGGSLKGPTYIRNSDRLLKRMIRGMLPWEKTKGRDAYRRLHCYIGTNEFSEDEIKNAVKVTVKQKPLKYTAMKDIVGALKK